MTLPDLDSNEIGRYNESIAIPLSGDGGFSAYLNEALESVSAAFSKYVRNRTVYVRTSGTVSSSASYAAVSVGTNIMGDDFTHASGVFTCQRPGTYRVQFNASWEGNATGVRGIRLLGSGSLGSRQRIESATLTVLDIYQRCEFLITTAATDTITAQALQDSGSALTLVGDITFERLQ